MTHRRRIHARTIVEWADEISIDVYSFCQRFRLIILSALKNDYFNHLFLYCDPRTSDLMG